MRKNATVHGNKGEFLDRKKQRFEMTQSSLMNDGDFDEKLEDDVDENPELNRAIEALSRKDLFFLTMSDKYI